MLSLQDATTEQLVAQLEKHGYESRPSTTKKLELKALELQLKAKAQQDKTTSRANELAEKQKQHSERLEVRKQKESERLAAKEKREDEQYLKSRAKKLPFRIDQFMQSDCILDSSKSAPWRDWYDRLKNKFEELRPYNFKQTRLALPRGVTVEGDTNTETDIIHGLEMKPPKS